MITVLFPTAELVGQCEAAQREIEADRINTLEALGTQLLSLARLDYVTKARGGTGADGVKWDEVTRSTIEARVRSRGPAKRIVEQRRELAAQIKTALRARSSKGKGAGKWVKDTVVKLRQRRKALSVKLQGMIDAEMANHEIGVDTGLQRASSAPGYKPVDGRGGTIFETDHTHVTVGYGREYSESFDKRRPLLPEELPEAWEAPLFEVIHERTNVILQRTFK